MKHQTEIDYEALNDMVVSEDEETPLPEGQEKG